MNNSVRRLLLGVIGTLVLSTATVPAMAKTIENGNEIGTEFSTSTKTTNTSSMDYLNKGTDTKVTVTTGAIQQNLAEGWNVRDGSIYYVKNQVKQTGWVMLGTWKCFNAEGRLLTNQWYQENNKWYFLDGHGDMLCGNKVRFNPYYNSLGGYFDASGAFTQTTDTTGTTIMDETILVEKSRSDGSSVSISMEEFNKKVDSGQIKPIVRYGSTGGSTGVGNGLSWYLV